MDTDHNKQRARALRASGASYKEIQSVVHPRVAKSTLAYWLKGVSLSQEAEKLLQQRQREGLVKARKAASRAKKKMRNERISLLNRKFQPLKSLLAHPDVAMVALAMLYLCEGGKQRKGALMFGNASPEVIRLFLRLLRQCFTIEESKFRCTVQGRADQDFPKLERYWAKTTGIPRSQFYSSRKDKRSIGIPTKKKEYRGVCRIDYFSSDVFTSVAQAIEVLLTGP